ncbi:hypothetical protein ACF3DV_03545 [Chlorogloeopsis fritschii PCC 9212]|nr:hypothetical protein [Chlorogloeopsis fritschii]
MAYKLPRLQGEEDAETLKCGEPAPWVEPLCGVRKAYPLAKPSLKG